MLNIFNIQRFSTHDGAGIRTNVFFKGCPLNCPWCSNPESRSAKANLLFDEKLCQRFGDCLKASNGEVIVENERMKIHQNASGNFDNLRNICPARALSVAGESKSVEEVIKTIEKDLPFYTHSGGGVTLTGGEPFSQGLDLFDLVKELKARKIDIAVETSLHVSWEKIQKYIPYIDCWLADIKHVDQAKFKKYTGGNAHLIVDNLHKLNEQNVNIIARVPIIPEFNDSILEISAIIDFAETLKSIKEIHFMPYHFMGESKYELMQIEYSYKGSRKIEPKELNGIIEYTKSKNLKYKIGG